MEFRILGPLEILGEGGLVDVGGAKQRTLLAALLLNANRVVSADKLIEALWDEHPPETAAKALQVHVSQLRKGLGRERIVTRPPGYSILVEPGELDLDRFERLVAQGGADELREALSLWRGPPLGDFARERFAQADIARLEELYLAALEDRIEADLAVGRHGELVGEVDALVSAHPLRERLRGQQMLALYRCGRQAEALEAYQDARRALVEELGIDPSRALQDLERAILTQDPALEPPAAQPTLTPAPPAPPSTERRVVSVLFADLVGFTGRSEALDPEDVRALLDLWYGRAREELERFGGTVEKFIGDAVVALFGAPIVHGDDPERAVRAALALREVIAELNRADPELDLQVRIGVNTGEAVVALGARTHEGEAMAAGDVVNTASRLQAAAPVDGILVGEETYRATRAAVRYEEVEPAEAKGKQQPLRAWAALEALVEPPTRPPSAVQLIGRELELGLLKGVWERVTGERRPYLVTVLAPAGIGKTRLAAEFVGALEQDGAQSVAGRSLAYGRGAGQGPFAGQVKRLCGIFETDPVPVAREKLDRAVAGLVGAQQATEIVPALAILIGLAPPEAAPEKQALFYAARRFVEALAQPRPTILVWEDIHWSDSTDLELLEHLAGRLGDVPVLLLALARPELLEARPDWGGGLPSYTGISLAPLGAADSLELASRLLALQGRPVTGEVAEQLAVAADGNPLFIEEFAASLAEGAAGPPIELPTNVRGIIAARLDALHAEERAVVLNAAVLGKIFWRGALERLRGDDKLPRLLDSLERRDLVRRQPVSRIENDEEFHFKHVLIREVAHATLPRAVRRERHAAAARFLEEAAGERAGEWATTLVQHWREADDPERELAWLLAAAERSWAAEAVRLYDRALELLEPESDRRRGLLLDRARALSQLGEHRVAAAELDALLPELEGRERFDALRARSRASWWQFEPAAARLYADQAHVLARELGDRQLEARALGLISIVESMEGKLAESTARNEHALSLWDHERDRDELSEAYEWLGLQRYWAGLHEPAVEAARRADELAREMYSMAGLSGPTVALALAGAGRHAEALQTFAASDRILQELDQHSLQARHRNSWAGTLRELGAVEEARRLNEEAIAVAAEASFTAGLVSGKIDLILCDLGLGEVGRAEAIWPELWETALATRGWHEWLWQIRLMDAKAQLALARGRAEEAAEHANAALELASRVGRKKYVIAARTVLGAALLEQNRAAHAVDVLREALAGAEQLGHPPSIVRAAACLTDALQSVGEDAAAEQSSRTATETVQRFVAALAPEHRDAFLRLPYVESVSAVAR
jgi:class 3 adenylate cyclase